MGEVVNTTTNLADNRESHNLSAAEKAGMLLNRFPRD